MCYKNELQRKNEEKLRRLLDADNICVPIKRYFFDIESKSGAVSYWYAIKDLMNWLLSEKIIGKSALSELTLNDFYDVEATDINVYLHHKEESGMSPTTLQTRKQIFSSFWEYLVDNNKCLVQSNIIKKVRYKGIDCSGLVKKLPTDNQLREMEEKALSKKDRFLRIRNITILRLLEGSGIRETELCGLNMSDVFLDAEIPYIRVVGKGVYREIEARTVYLTKSAMDTLRDWFTVRADFVASIAATNDFMDTDAVFYTNRGVRMKEKDVAAMFRTLSDGKVTPHMIRHWYASVIASNVGVVLAQQQLGHKSVNTTINKYASGIYGAKDVLANM